MKQFIVIAFFLPFTAIYNGPAYSQSKTESIIISREPTSEKTIIILDSSGITINGKPANEDKTATVTIIDNKKRSISIPSFTFSGSSTFLGVMLKDNDKGAEVSQVEKGSPAEKAGLKEGDIIQKMNDKAIENSKDLSSSVRNYKAGDKVKIEFLRGGKKKTITAKLENRRETTSITADSIYMDMPNPNRSFTLRGFGDRVGHSYLLNGNLTNIFFRPKMGMQVQETEDANGVKVLNVESGSPAETSGIKEGDLVTAINGEKITTINDITDNLGDRNGKDAELEILRNGKTLNIKVHFPKRLQKANL